MALEVKFSDLHVYCMESTIEMYGAIFPKLTHKTWETSERDVLLNMQSKKCGIQLDVNKITVRAASHLKSVKYWHKRQNICSNQSHYTRFEYFRFQCVQERSINGWKCVQEQQHKRNVVVYTGKTIRINVCIHMVFFFYSQILFCLVRARKRRSEKQFHTCKRNKQNCRLADRRSDNDLTVHYTRKFTPCTLAP